MAIPKLEFAVATIFEHEERVRDVGVFISGTDGVKIVGLNVKRILTSQTNKIGPHSFRVMAR